MKGFLKKEAFLHFEIIPRLRKQREMSEIICQKKTDTENIPDFVLFCQDAFSGEQKDGLTHAVTALPGGCHHRCPEYVFVKLNPEEQLQGSKYTAVQAAYKFMKNKSASLY